MGWLPVATAGKTNPVDEEWAPIVVRHGPGCRTTNETNRIANGFVGHHVNAAENDPNSLSIYLALPTVMKDVGVNSEPERAYATGGWGKPY